MCVLCCKCDWASQPAVQLNLASAGEERLGQVVSLDDVSNSEMTRDVLRFVKFNSVIVLNWRILYIII